MICPLLTIVVFSWNLLASNGITPILVLTFSIRTLTRRRKRFMLHIAPRFIQRLNVPSFFD